MATIISHIIASSNPPPKAYPFTAAIIGFFTFGTTLISSSRKKRFAISELLSPRNWVISAPEANDLVEPVSIITFIALSRSKYRKVRFNSFIRFSFREFRLRALFSLTMAISRIFSTFIRAFCVKCLEIVYKRRD